LRICADLFCGGIGCSFRGNKSARTSEICFISVPIGKENGTRRRRILRIYTDLLPESHKIRKGPSAIRFVVIGAQGPPTRASRGKSGDLLGINPSAICFVSLSAQGTASRLFIENIKGEDE